MRYNIKFAQKTHTDLGSAEIVRKFSDGKEKVEGVYNKNHAPDTTTTVRIKSNGYNKVFIDIEQERLNEIVPFFGLVSKDNQLIKTANKDFALDEFWLSQDLMKEIKHSGDSIDTSTVDGELWYSVFKADPDFYVDEPGSKRPESMSTVKFIVVPEKFDVGGLSEISKNYLDNYDIYRTLINMPRTTKFFILDAVNKPKEYDNDTDDRELDKLILSNLDNNFSRVYTEENFKDFFARVVSMKPQELEIGQLVRSSFKKGLISKKGDQWYFKANTLGPSLKDAEGLLSRKDYKKVLADLLNDFNLTEPK